MWLVENYSNVQNGFNLKSLLTMLFKLRSLVIKFRESLYQKYVHKNKKMIYKLSAKFHL